MTGQLQMTGMIFVNEIYKRFLLLWAYKFNFVMQTAMIGIIFIGITFFMGGGNLEPERLRSALLGYLIWFFALAAISDMSWGIREETQTGTLEQIYMSPLSSGMLMLGRSVASLLVSSVLVGVVGGALVLLFDVPFALRWQALPVFALTMIGLYGFGFLLGGATIIFKQIEALANMLQNGLLFLNGSLLPVAFLPDWLELVARTLPTTQGIIVLRQVLLNGVSLRDTWQDGSLIWLTVHSALYFAVGLLVFGWCDRKAREQGALGQY